MALVPNPFVAKQDRPGYGAIGAVVPGKYAQRWVVVYCTDIALCTLLDFDGGVLVKWSQLLRNPGPFFTLVYRWERSLPSSTIGVQFNRSPTSTIVPWFLAITDGTKRIQMISTQPNNVQLKQADFTDNPTIVGTWDVMPPVGGLGWQMFKTEDDALSTWPSALVWDW